MCTTELTVRALSLSAPVRPVKAAPTNIQTLMEHPPRVVRRELLGESKRPRDRPFLYKPSTRAPAAPSRAMSSRTQSENFALPFSLAEEDPCR